MKTNTKILAVLMTLALIASGCVGEMDSIPIEDTDENAEAAIDWVDLGLPSGLLWATRNVGAYSPKEYGNYFAWGENQSKSGNSDWSTYRYTEYANGQYWFTKYCSDSSVGYNGYTDTLTILQPEDDAATANYGGRTPTKEEWQELLYHTTLREVIHNGTHGLSLTGPNGNSIFLPAAGSYDDGQGSYYYYWTGSFCSTDSYHAWYVEFVDGMNPSSSLSTQARFVLYSIRAVRSAE